MNSNSIAPALTVAAVMAGCSEALGWVVETLCACSLVVMETAGRRTLSDDELQEESPNEFQGEPLRGPF